MAEGANIEADGEHPQGDVGDREADRLAVGNFGDLHSKRRDSEHRHEHHDTEDDVVGIEAVSVEAEALPSDEHGHEERGEDRKA